MSAVKKPIKTEDSQEIPKKTSKRSTKKAIETDTTTKKTTKKAAATTPAVKPTTKRTTKKAATKKTVETTTESQPDLIEAAKSGDRLTTLIALRDLLAERLQNTNSSRDVSSISRRLMQCVCEIEALEKLKKEMEQRSFSLYDFQKRIIKGANTKSRSDTKKIMENKRAIDNQHTLNGLTSEHECF